MGAKVRAPAARRLAREPIDVQVAAEHWSHVEREELGSRRARDSAGLCELKTRPGGAKRIGDTGS
ncbi:hypothetical protein ACIPPJ_07050 [Streptomyces sp. NPDC086091]|uniref:hypothetical protein n=1 Tax=Streptomyces sp. NPDC086091 TaxID=3365751 RepID=UPI00380B8AE6